MAVHLTVTGDMFDGVFFVQSFFPRDVMDEIWDLIVSVSENFPIFSYIHASKKITLISKKKGRGVFFFWSRGVFFVFFFLNIVILLKLNLMSSVSEATVSKMHRSANNRICCIKWVNKWQNNYR